MKGSITEKNSMITAIADIIQDARRVLTDNNKSLNLSSSDTRRIVLYCLLYLRFNSNDSVLCNTCFPKVLEKIGLSYSVSELGINADISSIRVQETINTLHSITDYPDWKELLNYSYETLEYDVEQYFSVKKNRGVRRSNSMKKKFGIYYTPNDVVSFMTSRCLKHLTDIKDFPSIIDCSVGSGIFMLNCFDYLNKVYNIGCELDQSLQIIQKCIWGVDISNAAVDSCRIVFVQYFIDQYGESSKMLNKVWHVISDSFIVGDATKLHEVIDKNNMPVKYDCIIGNPPYVTNGKSTNLFISFVDNMINHSTDISFSALVLPLSVCYSKGEGYIGLRERIQNDNASWEFLNYDRSPDSLFGDQVKTRNTILFRHTYRQKKSIYTTTLQRWTSENRYHLFENFELCDISGIKISDVVPKISGVDAALAYEKLHGKNGCLCDLLMSYKDTGTNLVINGTAYNWLCAYDHFPPSTDEEGNQYYSGSAKRLCAVDKEARDFCIALLSNRIAYWYWVAIGDGFHLNASFLREFCVSKDNFSADQYEMLCHLGREYSERIKQHPTVSYNAGKTIVNYSHWEALDIVKQIEEIIICGMKLPYRFGEQIEKWYNNQVGCNRDSFI